MPISEIAKILDRSKKYIVTNRMILRRFLNFSKDDQKRAWAIEHQSDLEQLSIEEIRQKHSIGKHTIQRYRKLLIELKHNENE